MTENQFSALQAEVNRVRDTVDQLRGDMHRMDRGDAAHDVLLAKASEAIDAVAAGVRSLHDELTAHRMQTQSDLADIRKRMAEAGKDRTPLFKDWRVIVVLLAGLFGGSGGGWTLDQILGKDQPAAVAPAPPVTSPTSHNFTDSR